MFSFANKCYKVFLVTSSLEELIANLVTRTLNFSNTLFVGPNIDIHLVVMLWSILFPFGSRQMASLGKSRVCLGKALK
jgi:hypothetical protein